MNPLLIALVVGLAISWAVALSLLTIWWTNRGIRALRERALLSVILAVGGSVYVVAAASVDAGGSVELARTIARLVFITLMIVPGTYWLWLYWRGRF